MANKPIEPNETVDKVLAALRNATPPEGMEARIAQRLHAVPSAGPPVSTFSAIWWRGAFAGAATAALATAVLFFAFHRLAIPANHSQSAANITHHQPTQPNTAPKVSTAREDRTLCASPSVLQAQNPTSTPFDKTLRAETRIESAAPSYPAPALPLTAQERALAQLVRTADPKQLAALTPEQEAKVDAEKAAEFARFFAHPTPPPSPDVNTQPTSDTNQTAPNANPSTLEANPEAPSATNPQIPSSANEEQQ